MAKLQIVPKTTAGTVTVDAIPAEFVEEFEQAWAALQANPNTELRVEFESEDASHGWTRLAKSYGEQRVNAAGEAEYLRVRRLPKRGLPKTVGYYSITRVDASEGTPAESAETPAETPERTQK